MVVGRVFREDIEILTLGGLKICTSTHDRGSIRSFTTQRDFHLVAVDFTGFEMGRLDLTKPYSQPKSDLHIDTIDPGARLRIILLNITLLQGQHLSALKNGVQNRGVLPTLIKRRRGEAKVTMAEERAVVGGGEVKLREVRIGDGEFELTGKKDEPENEESEAEGKD
ncbi:hypothetical protein TIFTF001_008653 [Ficus carica]|uniref:Uncharacterized protein n=1 Tax=Ficus carica TaxID=3494 RepID=A0AA88A5A3_FICCA|nr:hypothetical protein TIFTF001_008653 [Ficus carica]